MKRGFPQFTRTAQKGERGVNIVSRIVSDTFGWLFKRNHQEHDFGIDCQIEVVTQVGAVTGQMLAAQIKYGKTFFQEKNKWGYVFRGELKHFNYLSNYPMPVLIIICHPDTEDCYWVKFEAEQTQVTEAGWKITIPFANKLSTSQPTLESLLPLLTDSLSELCAYWELNNLIIESSYIHFIISRAEVNSSDTTRPRAFFDRLRTTKELAYHCQGKVDFSFYGYEDNPRELFEIEELRRYVALLDATLPELFFFALTERPAAAIKIFAFCQTAMSWPDGRSTREVTRQVVYETDKVGAFLERHYVGLNEIAEWLSMPIEEIKKISFAVAKCLGVVIPDGVDDA